MSDWFSKFFEKAKNMVSSNDGNFLHSAPSSDETSAKMPFLKLLFDPFRWFVDRIKNLFLLSAFYAVVLTIVSVVFGSLYICGFQSTHDIFFYCQDFYLLYLLNIFTKTFIVAVFIIKWLDLVSGKDFSWSEVAKINKTALKTYAVLLIFASLFLFPILSLYLLIIRVPNPDWLIETAYFGVVCPGFLVPLIAVRFYSIIAFAAQNQPAPKFSEIWNKTRGNMLKILLCLFAILIIFIFVSVNMMANLSFSADVNPIYFGLVSEFIFNFILLLFTSLLSGHCLAQKKLLFGENENE